MTNRREQGGEERRGGKSFLLFLFLAAFALTFVQVPSTLGHERAAPDEILKQIGVDEKLGGQVTEMAFIVNLPDVGGEKKLMDKGYNVYCLTEFEGD